MQEYNQRIHSSLNGKSPMERFFSESTLIIRMSDQEVERSFLLEIERKVSNDSVIVIDEKEYEVNYKYQGQKLLIRYSPDLKKVCDYPSDNPGIFQASSRGILVH